MGGSIIFKLRNYGYYAQDVAYGVGVGNVKKDCKQVIKSFKQKQGTVVQEIFACKIFRLLIFRVV